MMEEGGCKAVFTACCNAEVQSNSKEYILCISRQKFAITLAGKFILVIIITAGEKTLL